MRWMYRNAHLEETVVATKMVQFSPDQSRLQSRLQNSYRVLEPYLLFHHNSRLKRRPLGVTRSSFDEGFHDGFE